MYTLSIPVTNTTGSNAYLTGYFDYNRNGAFNAGESVTVTVPNNSTFATITWNGLPNNFPIGVVTDFGFRFRLSSNQVATQLANGLAPDGEVEDYLVPISFISNCVNIADFSFTQNICNPKSIQFSNSSQGATTFTWNFGNNTTNIGTVNPTVIYANYGTYNVKLKIQTSYGCVDSVTKNIAINVQQDNNLIINNDFSICSGNSVTLNITDTGLNHCWSPIIGISNINSATSTITPSTTTTYYFTSQALGNNIVVNGDFSAGNSGFSSDYVSAFPNLLEGQYWVGNNVLSWNPNLTACGDYAGGNGNMLLINGASVQNAKIWMQTISVTPNSNYAFSTWIQSLHATNPAILKFSINGNIIGNNITAGGIVCQWSKFFATWNSGNSTTAIISIINNNTVSVGNDFALDDISFNQVIMKQDSVKITVNPPPTIIGSGLPNSICQSDSSQLNASGASSFSWLPTTGLSNPNIANPKASPATTTTYTVSGYNIVGCSASKPVTVIINPKPTITKIADPIICKDSTVQISAFASNALFYSWLPANTLSNPSIYNPLANPVSTTNYVLTVMGNNGCSSKDSIIVTVLSKPTIQVRVDTNVCNKVPVTLTSTSINASYFNWLPIAGLSDPTNANPVATPSVSTQYIVTASNGTCTSKDTINLGIFALPNVVKSADTTICKTGTANLVVSGGASYSWFPNYAINNPTGSTISAIPDTTVKYFVTITGSNSCKSLDSIKVTVNPKPVFSLLPAVAKICKGDSIQLKASGGDLYSWVPNTNISSTTTPNTKVYPSITTMYKVGITHLACKVIDTLFTFISLNGSLTTSVTNSNDIDCSHGQSTLHANGGSTYEWVAAQGITNLSSANPIVTPTQTTTYYVKIVDSKGCIGYDSVKVNVDFTSGASQYKLPSAFTPDGNGLNDCFGLKYWGNVTQFDFAVYSRWGQLIFHTNNASDCWDGKFKGQTQDAGTYIYQIKAKTSCGEVYRKGTIVLIR